MASGFTGAILSALTISSVAAADSGSVPIGPKQPFVGVVNGLFKNAGIAVVFSPEPSSPSARSASVTVTFGNVTAAPARCSGVIDITQLAFSPASVPAGGSSTVHLTSLNCTGATQRTELVWRGRFASSKSGIPPGCPVIDPLAQGVVLKPHGSFRGQLTYTVPSSCTATELHVTAQISQAGGVVASKAAVLSVT
jgi:hypothetical protein